MTTNQTLLALAGSSRSRWLGPAGAARAGRDVHRARRRTRRSALGAGVAARVRPADVQGVRRPLAAPGAEVIAGCASAGVHPGYALGRDYEGLDDVLLVAVTEKRTPADIDRLADVLAEVLAAMELIYEQSRAGPPRRAACRGRRPARARAAGASCAAHAPPRLPGGVRARARAPLHRPRRPQLRHRHRLLPARLLHDEAQPARQRARRRAARLPRPAPAPGGRGRAGRARADVAAAGDPRRGGRPARGDAAAGRRVAGRADRAAC